MTSKRVNGWVIGIIVIFVVILLWVLSLIVVTRFDKPATSPTHGPVAATAPELIPSPSPTASPTPAPIPTMFFTAGDLVDTLNAHSLPCGPAVVVANPSLATSLIDCGPNIVVGVYSSHDDALGAYRLIAEQAKASGTFAAHMAVGSNWTVSSDDASYAKQVAILFGVPYFATD